MRSTIIAQENPFLVFGSDRSFKVVCNYLPETIRFRTGYYIKRFFYFFRCQHTVQQHTFRVGLDGTMSLDEEEERRVPQAEERQLHDEFPLADARRPSGSELSGAEKFAPSLAAPVHSGRRQKAGDDDIDYDDIQYLDEADFGATTADLAGIERGIMDNQISIIMNVGIVWRMSSAIRWRKGFGQCWRIRNGAGEGTAKTKFFEICRQ